MDQKWAAAKALYAANPQPKQAPAKELYVANPATKRVYARNRCIKHAQMCSVQQPRHTMRGKKKVTSYCQAKYNLKKEQWHA